VKHKKPFFFFQKVDKSKINGYFPDVAFEVCLSSELTNHPIQLRLVPPAPE